MNHSTNRCIALVVVIALAGALSGAARGAEMVDNPQYQSWAKHKPGTSITLQHDTSAMGMAMIQHVVQTLMDVTPEKATVEIAVTMEMGGQKHDVKQKHDIPAKVEKGQENLPPSYKGTVKDLPNESVEIGGKSYDCKVVEFSGESDKGKASGKMWRNLDIPGDMAKLEMNTQGQRPATIKMTVTDVKVKD